MQREVTDSFSICCAGQFNNSCCVRLLEGESINLQVQLFKICPEVKGGIPVDFNSSCVAQAEIPGNRCLLQVSICLDFPFHHSWNLGGKGCGFQFPDFKISLPVQTVKYLKNSKIEISTDVTTQFFIEFEFVKVT